MNSCKAHVEDEVRESRVLRSVRMSLPRGLHKVGWKTVRSRKYGKQRELVRTSKAWKVEVAESSEASVDKDNGASSAHGLLPLTISTDIWRLLPGHIVPMTKADKLEEQWHVTWQAEKNELLIDKGPHT